MHETGLARTGGNAMLPAANEWETTCAMGNALLQSGLLPSSVKTWQAAAAIIQKGRELGIPPMYSLSNVVVIQGKPTANAELMAALIYRDHGDEALVYEETTANVCRISYKRRAWASRKEYSFTHEDAKQAGLLSNQTWQKYPAAMLRARCISAVARLAFPDSIGGMYTPEELGAAVVVDSDGVIQVSDVPAPSCHAPQPEPVRATNAGNGMDAAPLDPSSVKVTKRTLSAIHAKASELGVTHDELHDKALEDYGVQSMNDLTEAQAREIAHWLRDMPRLPDDVNPDFGDPFSADTPAEEPPATETVQTVLGDIQVPAAGKARNAQTK